MRSSIAILFVGIIFLTSCGSSSTLEELKTQKSEIEGEIKALKDQLAELDEAIKKIDTTSNDEKLELVTVIDLNPDVFNNYIEAQGKTYTENNVMVTTDMGGLVKGVFVDEGQYVNQGQTLIQLDNSIITSQMAELETAISLAREVFDKRQRLWNQNIGSEIEYLQAKNQYESLIDKKASANVQLSKTSIKAPISGYIDMINVKLGEMAAPGMPACQIVNNTMMEVKIDLPEVYLGKVNKGDEILIELPAIEKEVKAKVSAVGQTVNAYNRAFQVIASIDNKDNIIKPNMLVKAKFNNLTVSDAIVIPSNLLQESAQGYFVFTAETDSLTNEVVAVKKQIEVGESYGGQIVVTKGLNESDVIINEGFRNVLDGQLIKIQG
jgi:membrane fusion protein (multidrug efflux system)